MTRRLTKSVGYAKHSLPSPGPAWPLSPRSAPTVRLGRQPGSDLSDSELWQEKEDMLVCKTSPARMHRDRYRHQMT